MALAEVREVLDTYSIAQALELLQAKAAEPPLRRLAERDHNFQQVRTGLCAQARMVLREAIAVASRG